MEERIEYDRYDQAFKVAFPRWGDAPAHAEAPTAERAEEVAALAPDLGALARRGLTE